MSKGQHDIIIVGAGLTGITIARLLADTGLRPLVLERRPFIGGNCRDAVHKRSGIRYGVYGPHYFRTNSDAIWRFANRFAHFRRWEAKVVVKLGLRFAPWPVSVDTIAAYGGRVGFVGTPKNFSEAVLAQVPRRLYEDYIETYTRKQWDVPPSRLSASLAGRIDIRDNVADRRLKTHHFQGLPVGGYTAWLTQMLSGIDAVCDVKETRGSDLISGAERVVYTGSIDEFFDYRFGRLKYRTQHREQIWRDDCETYNPCVQVNFPSLATRAIRAIEWKHMQAEGKPRFNGSLITYEYPSDAQSPDKNEYPFPDEENAERYKRYADYAVQAAPNVTFAGRLGKYRYLDMDQAIGAAFKVAKALRLRGTSVAA